jgi:hypothetical protein
MSDELVEGLVVAALAEMKAYREGEYDKIRGEIRVLGTLLELTDGADVRQTGLSLLEQLTKPIVRDVAVEVVRAILIKGRGSPSVTVTPSWLTTLALDRTRLEHKTGLDEDGIDIVLGAMFRMLLTSRNVAELDEVRIKLMPAKETMPPENVPVSNSGGRGRSETADQGRSPPARLDSGKSDNGTARRQAAENTAPPTPGIRGNRNRRGH